jgi:hypothetical protein
MSTRGQVSGRGRGRGRGGQSTNRQPAQPEVNPASVKLELYDWPTPEEALAKMERMSQYYLGTGPKPREQAHLPVIGARRRFPQFYAAEKTTKLTAHAVDDTRRDGSHHQFKSLMSVVQLGVIRANDNEPSVFLTTRPCTFGYSESRPDMPVKDVDEDTVPYVWQSAENAISILNRDREITEVYESRYSNVIPAIIASNHANDCACCSIGYNNNLTYTFFSQICLPKSLVPEADYRAVPEIKHSLLVPKQMLNRSILFAGEVSTAATATPRMVLRQPLSRLARDASQQFKAAGSQRKMLEEPGLLRSICKELAKQDYRNFLRYYAEDSGKTEEDDFYRFMPKAVQMKNADLALTHMDSTDYVLSNSAHVSPFHGTVTCPYCDLQITMYGIKTLVRHFMKCHRKLRDSYFSCPTCLQTTITEWCKFQDHWDSVHHATSAMIVTLYETNVHSRICLGMALSAVIAMMDCLPQDLSFDDDEDEDAQSYGIYGGYTALMDGHDKLLLTTICKLQKENIPEEVQDQVQQIASEKLARALQQKEEEAAAERRQEASPVPEPLPWTEVVVRKPLRLQQQSVKTPLEQPQVLMTPPAKKSVAEPSCSKTADKVSPKYSVKRTESKRMTRSRVVNTDSEDVVVDVHDTAEQPTVEKQQAQNVFDKLVESLLDVEEEHESHDPLKDPNDPDPEDPGYKD